jgi:hypothetical protein
MSPAAAEQSGKAPVLPSGLVIVLLTMLTTEPAGTP